MDPADLDSRAGVVAAFLGVLRQTGAALDARQLRAHLVARGLPSAQVGAAWRRARAAVRRAPGVTYDPVRGTYRLGVDPGLSAEEALDLLLPPRLSGRRMALAAAVRHAVRERDDLELRLRSAYAQAGASAAAQRRAAQIEAVRALADVLAEVEELAAAGADLQLAAERVRALGKGFGLVPVGRAGQATVFDPARHTPLGLRPPDGRAVTVVRPGYVALLPDRTDGATAEAEVLIHRAQVVWDGRG